MAFQDVPSRGLPAQVSGPTAGRTAIPFAAALEAPAAEDAGVAGLRVPAGEMRSRVFPTRRQDRPPPTSH